MAVQNDNTILKKADLKAYHEKIAPMLGGTFMVSTNNSDYYSTDEKVVGVWTDGRPLYQKTVVCGSLPINNRKKVASGITNIANLVLMRGSFKVGNSLSPLPYVSSDTTYNVRLDYLLSTNEILIQTINDFGTTSDCVVTLKYTKTTDAAGSAATTPGAYDINFPNTWPANTEIYFGNGLYGQHFTGTITAAANNWIATVLLPAGSPAVKIVNWGGHYNYNNNGQEMAVGGSWSATQYNNGIDNMTAVGGSMTFGSSSGSVRNNAPYDFFVTYTK